MTMSTISTMSTKSTRSTRSRRLAGAAALTLLIGPVLAACGSEGSEQAATPPAASQASGSTTGSSTGDSAPAPAADAPSSPTLFGVDVVRVASGETTNLNTLSVDGKPTLLWFWAPHCSRCRAESPELLSFAAEYGDKIQVVGLGAQDSLSQAEDFLDDTGTQALEMVWDKTGSSWVHYKVTNQPTVILVGADGEQKEKLFNNFDEETILEAAGLA